jgi:hypothetical protein
LSTRKTGDISRALSTKGFECDKSHHEMYWLHVEGRRSSVRTRISHGAREYGDNLLGQMARQLGLSRSEFDDLVDCPLSEEDYVTRLVDRGRIRP